MAHIITNECVACGACEETCPVGAISLGDNGIYVIRKAFETGEGFVRILDYVIEF